MKDSAGGDKWYYSFLPNGIAGGATSTLIPLFALLLGAGAAEVGIIAASSSIASVPAFMLWGRASDRLGRRRAFVVLSFVGMAVSLGIMAVSQNIPELYLANLLLGALTSAGVVGTVLIMETSDRTQWPDKLALFSQIGGIGFIVGLAIGASWLAGSSGTWGAIGSMRALFLAGAMLSVLSALMAWRWIKDPETPVKRSTVHISEHLYLAVERVKFLPMRLLHYFDFANHGGKRPASSRTLRSYYVCVVLLFSGFTAFYAMFPIFLVGPAGFDASQVFAVYIASQAVSAAIYSRVGRWISRLGARRAQMAGATARVVLFPAFLSLVWLPLGLTWAFIAALLVHGLIGASWAVINVSGSTIVSRLAPREGRAQTFGLYNAIMGIGSIAGPLLGGFVTEGYGYEGGFLISSVLILAGVLLLASLRIQED